MFGVCGTKIHWICVFATFGWGRKGAGAGASGTLQVGTDIAVRMDCTVLISVGVNNEQT
jgi:hypothetical protein